MQKVAGSKKKSWAEVVYGLAENVLFVLFAVMVLIVFINVVARFIFNSSIVESEEIARYCFVWASFLGAVLAFNNNEHIGVDLVVKLVPENIRVWVLVFANLCMLTLAGICTWYGWVLCESTFGWPSPATRIPYGYIGLVVPASFLAIFVMIAGKTVDLVGRKA